MSVIELIVFADDLTGALDTGVQFATRGARTHVAVTGDALLPTQDASVLVINTESRHIEAFKAYRLIRSLTTRFSETGIKRFYKKTDSVLRGNVGAELAALRASTDTQILPFIPAYPANGRITRDGIQYVNGIPIDRSPFANDPMNPVTESRLHVLLSGGFEKEIHCYHRPEEMPDSATGICVFDAETEDDLQNTAHALCARGLLSVCAGCAGFAAHLPLPHTVEVPQCPPLKPPFFVLSGSINRTTLSQIAEAGRAGARIFRLTPEQLLGQEPWDETAAYCLDAIEHGHSTILTSALTERDAREYLAEAAKMGIAQKEARERVMTTLAECGKSIAPPGKSVVIGGDTLLATLRLYGIYSLTPLREIAPGVAASLAGDHIYITKSGGFGDGRLLSRLCSGELI